MGGCGSKSGDRGDVVSHLDDTSTSQNKQDNFKIGDSDGGEAKPIDVMSVCDLTKVDLAADASQSGENFITCESPTPKMTPDAAVACYVSSTGQSMTSDTTLDDSVPVKPDISCEVHRYSERLILPTASADLESIKGAAQTMRSDNNASAFFDATGFRTSPVATSKQEELYPRAGIRSILHLERTNKFAAYCLRKPGHHAHIATPNVRQKSFSIGGNGFATEISSKFNGPFTPAMRHRSLNQQLSQKMIGDLRNTLNRLHTLKSSPGKRAQLIRLDSSGMNHLCCICKKTNTRGLMCEKDHFTCLDCFGPHVEKVCKNTKVLRKDNFGIHCPLRICDSACWNSYHVRKVLDGPSLELYIDTLVTMCREEELRHTPASTAAVHVGSEPYQSETLQVLRNQIKELNMVPLEYIPLEDINFELQEIFDRLNNGMDYDEARMEFLLMCMKQNPDFIAEEEEKNRKWRAEMAAFTSECLQIMRGYVPPHIFEATLQSLQEDDGFPKELAKRLRSKKCLWLIRMNAWDIERIHEVELMGRFNPVAQGLDIVEMAAIYTSIPEKFINDPTGRKSEWRNNFETSLKEMDKKRRNNALKGNALRNPVYKKMPVGPFIRRLSMRKMEVTGGIANDSEVQSE